MVIIHIYWKNDGRYHAKLVQKCYVQLSFRNCEQARKYFSVLPGFKPIGTCISILLAEKNRYIKINFSIVKAISGYRIGSKKSKETRYTVCYSVKTRNILEFVICRS